MCRHRQLMFLLAAAYLTTTVVSSPTDENTNTKIISSREVSRTEPSQSEPSRSEPSTRSESSTRAEFQSQQDHTPRCQSSSQSSLSTQSPLSTQSQLTTRCEFRTHGESTTRSENTTRVSSSDEDVNESTVSASSTVGFSAVADGLRDQVMRLTNQLSKAVAALHTAQQRERKMAVLEREKYSYLKAASDRVLGMVDNVQHFEKGLAANTSRERQIQQRLARDHRTQGRSRRKLQAIRRLLAGAEVGLVHIESSRTLNKCSANSRKSPGAQHADKTPSRSRPSDA
ncbi:hypothetical protein ACI65C_010172 [Semiaphis heraclei]